MLRPIPHLHQLINPQQLTNFTFIIFNKTQYVGDYMPANQFDDNNS